MGKGPSPVPAVTVQRKGVLWGALQYLSAHAEGLKPGALATFQLLPLIQGQTCTFALCQPKVLQDRSTSTMAGGQRCQQPLKPLQPCAEGNNGQGGKWGRGQTAATVPTAALRGAELLWLSRGSSGGDCGQVWTLHRIFIHLMTNGKNKHSTFKCRW